MDTNNITFFSFTGANVSIIEVAKIMKKDQQFIRIGLQEQWLPIGVAYKMDGSNEYSYYVSPKKLYEYTGYLYKDTMLAGDYLHAEYKI